MSENGINGTSDIVPQIDMEGIKQKCRQWFYRQFNKCWQWFLQPI
jgi:hypothetical protein